MEQWFHASRGSLLGKTDYELYPLEAAENFRTVDEKVLDSGEAVSAEDVLTLPDGKQAAIFRSSSLCAMRVAAFMPLAAFLRTSPNANRQRRGSTNSMPNFKHKAAS